MFPLTEDSRIAARIWKKEEPDRRIMGLPNGYKPFHIVSFCKYHSVDMVIWLFRYQKKSRGLS
ncbi:hypothetical Protein YC6258_03217 [Gynuella sunshinyii YC6258]|uniref:Uncharacterized protein n=1 Tax=Gynuella sunshinyii YC6258 TaxID=1445510 RepID=A0A0C5VPH2_9GAMM|nr:hypothetical Protein YC6258_03217 [Gynuella sunshinyii YC6258]